MITTPSVKDTSKDDTQDAPATTTKKATTPVVTTTKAPVVKPVTTTTKKVTTPVATTAPKVTTTVATTTKAPEIWVPDKPVINIDHPSSAPETVPSFITSIKNFSQINGNSTYPDSFDRANGCYVAGYTGSYMDAGRIRLESSTLSRGPVFLLFKDLSIINRDGSAVYNSSPDLDINIYLDGNTVLTSNGNVTLNNNSGMSEGKVPMVYDNCSTLRLIGINGTDKLTIISSSNRSSIAGRVIVQNCTLDLSQGKLTEYANICIERGGRVIFPNGAVISLPSSLPAGVYLSCNYVSGVITAYSVDNNRKIDLELGYTSGKTVHLSGQSGYVTAEMPKAGVTLSPDAGYCAVTYSAGESEIFPTANKGVSEFYVPNGVNLKQIPLNLYIGKNYSAKIGAKTYTSSQKVTVDASSGNVSITYIHPDKSTSTEKVKFIQASSHILYLNIDEGLGSINAMHGDKNHETYCYGDLTYATGEDTYSFSSAFTIKGRGNATWDDQKKGYALKLYEDNTYEKKNKVDISGMGKSASWVLVSGHRDRTLIRTALALTLSKQIGMKYTVNFQFVDLYMNGSYLGLYMLTQKIEIAGSQVDIEKAKGDSLSGGYILEFDNYTDTPQFRLKLSGMAVTVKDPDDLTAYSAIEKFMNEAETAINDANGYNSKTKKYWYDYLDVTSFAQLWIVREYTMDFDATVNFKVYYDPSDGKLHAGPAWDFDNSMARTAGKYADPESELIPTGDRNKNCWLTKLMKYERFTDEIVRLYNANRSLFNTNSQYSIYALALKYYDELETSVKMNFTVWEGQLHNTSWNTPADQSYDGHFAILTDFLIRRNEFWSYYIPSLES